MLLNLVADCLSRLGVMKDKFKLSKAMIHAVSVELPATEDFLNCIRTETKTDPELQLLTQQVQQGWPEKINSVDERIKQYWSFREDITVFLLMENLLLQTACWYLPDLFLLLLK